jgi:hypothetical protein
MLYITYFYFLRIKIPYKRILDELIMEVVGLIKQMDKLVDSLTEEDLKTLIKHRKRNSIPQRLIGKLVQGIMFPNLNIIHWDWKDISRESKNFCDRLETWEQLNNLFVIFHNPEIISKIENHANYETFVAAINKLKEDEDVDSIKDDFKTALKEALKCLIPEPAFYVQHSPKMNKK